MLTTTKNRIAEHAKPSTGWQAELAAIADLTTFDVELFALAAEQAANELAEIQRAHEAVTAKLQQAKQQQGAVDARFAEILSATSLLRKAIDEDANFHAIHGEAAEAAIENVRPLKQVAN